MLEDHVDALADVDRYGDLGALVQKLEPIVLLRRDVDGGRDLLAGHRRRAGFGGRLPTASVLTRRDRRCRYLCCQRSTPIIRVSNSKGSLFTPKVLPGQRTPRRQKRQRPPEDFSGLLSTTVPKSPPEFRWRP